jgi:hypothetical protein
MPTHDAIRRADRQELTRHGARTVIGPGVSIAPLGRKDRTEERFKTSSAR